MIRFRTSQLMLLPDASMDIQVLLPNGRFVDCHFNRHVQNPNISGRELVAYIKQKIAMKACEEIFLERRSPKLWIIHLLAETLAVTNKARVPEARVRRGALQPKDLASLLNLADRENARGRRLSTYKRVLRPAGLRQLVLGVVGAKCMVDGCRECQKFEADWGPDSGDVIVEVHHIEEIARVIDHHPRNLCVLCANHHRFVHNSGSWVVHHVGSNVVFGRGTREMLIVRPDTLFPPP